LKVPYIVRAPGLGKLINTYISIPEDITIQSLNLTLLPEGGVTGNYWILDSIGSLNNVNLENMYTMEFIALWYRVHLKLGGMPLENYDELKEYFQDVHGNLIDCEDMNFELAENDEESIIDYDCGREH
jgi:hypothetical protein